MVCMRVAFHENDGNHENDENDEDNSDGYKPGAECWISGNHGNHEDDKNLWGANHRFPKQWLARPLCRNVSGIFLVEIYFLEDFAANFRGGFCWALFPHKNKDRKSSEKIREKIRRLKIEIREKSVLPKTDPNKCSLFILHSNRTSPTTSSAEAGKVALLAKCEEVPSRQDIKALPMHHIKSYHECWKPG